MTFWRRWFDRGAGAAEERERARDWRGAASLHIQGGRFDQAARCFEEQARSEPTFEKRVAAFEAAIQALPALAVEARKTLEAGSGMLVLDRARTHGLAGDAERAQLALAAGRLESGGRFAHAADAFELLGRGDDAARCLEQGGEVDRLETLLSRANAEEAHTTALRRALDEAELAFALGDRATAKAALRRALVLDPRDRSVSARLHDLEARSLSRRVAVRVDGREHVVAFGFPATIGRAETTLVVRGSSVSRTHLTIDRTEDRFTIRDAGSRNGTLLRGIPLAATYTVSEATTVGLGDDVLVHLEPAGETLRVRVERGLDDGLEASILRDDAEIALPRAPGILRREGEGIVLVVDELVDLAAEGASSSRRVKGSIGLLRGDVVTTESGTRVEFAP